MDPRPVLTAFVAAVVLTCAVIGAADGPAGAAPRVTTRPAIPDPGLLKAGDGREVAIPFTSHRIELVFVPGGQFRMGSPETKGQELSSEGPQHDVALDPFWIAKFEVTHGLYQQFWRDDDNLLADLAKAGVVVGPKQPLVLASKLPKPPGLFVCSRGAHDTAVEDVSQYAAQAFCAWLSVRAGEAFRLPTEAEWEYACRAGNTGVRPGDVRDEALAGYAWFDKAGDGDGPKPVGRKKPNPWGIHDLFGNVAEWTLDGWEGHYARFPKGVSPNPWVRRSPAARYGVLRGGDWRSSAGELRSAARERGEDAYDDGPNIQGWNYGEACKGRSRSVGFRVVVPYFTFRPPDGRESHIVRYDRFKAGD